MKKPTTRDEVMPMAAPSGLMVSAPIGYEMYDPNDASAPVKTVIGFLVTVVSGKNVTWPITTEGDPPAGWIMRDRNYIVPTDTKETTNADEAT